MKAATDDGSSFTLINLLQKYHWQWA